MRWRCSSLSLTMEKQPPALLPVQLTAGKVRERKQNPQRLQLLPRLVVAARSLAARIGVGHDFSTSSCYLRVRVFVDLSPVVS
jgi:hypothetical protein